MVFGRVFAKQHIDGIQQITVVVRKMQMREDVCRHFYNQSPTWYSAMEHAHLYDGVKPEFKYLSKYKKVRIKEGGDWLDATMLKYIEDIVQKLNV